MVTIQKIQCLCVFCLFWFCFVLFVCFFKRLKLIINKNMFKSFLAELPIKN